ncbi:hypothetical protein BTO11_11350 [Psychrosphaera saromensis]|uniref:histidine kinase n=1 Tax=Psychrosphaera saromensis TaxID=716813 RepID=A0A2S7UW71_9GAMM|nr:hypothetical protein BTO11_11350 [Psychrosphaera saromensis]
MLIIALAQVALLSHFKSNVESEIERRGKDFADRILRYTIDSIEDEDQILDSETKVDFVALMPAPPIIGFEDLLRIQVSKKKDFNFKIELPAEILNSANQLMEVIGELPEQVKPTVMSLAQQLNSKKINTIEMSEDGYRVKLSIKRPRPNKMIKRHLTKQIENMKNIGLENDSIKIETILDDGTTKVFHAKSVKDQDPNVVINKRKSQVSELFNYVILMIVLTTLLSIFLVFWLSKRFSKPLQELINGFKQLENGQFGIQVTPQGVSEINQTIQRFNTMSIQLAKLADAESKLQEQHHLTEISDVSKGIAHALRNPMHTIGLAIEQLQSNTLSEPVKQKLFAKIQSKIVQLDKNINALLTITSDGLERVQTLSLSGLINDVVLELKQTHDNSKGKLKIDLVLDDTIKILGAESEFRSILHTLVFNAYEASVIADQDLMPNPKADLNATKKDPNDGLIHLIIKTHSKNELTVISITDFGSGLNPNIENRLFTAHCSTKAEGAGMGLYISKKLIELHYEGSLTVQNNTDNDHITGVTALCTIPQTSKKNTPENDSESGFESGFESDSESTTKNKNTGSN